MKINMLFLILFVSVISCETSNKSSEKTEDTKPSAISEKMELEIPTNQKLTKEQQIASAIFAAPTEAREGAKVYGYNENGDFDVLREGTNEFICVADNPEKSGFQVVCYHASLEPLMESGRKLDKEGKSREEKEAIRESEAASGKLKLPENPATLHIYFGEKAFFNTTTNLVENAKYRYVVYTPYATQATTGLPLKPNASSHPWLMFPGKYNAHIMISPTE